MDESQDAALSRLIKDHVCCGRTRRETVAQLVTGIARAGTVNLNRLAAHIESDAQTASVHRRFERFFSEVQLNAVEVAQLTVSVLGLCGKPWHLAMDRTNWKFGRTDLNVLVLSVAVDRVCVPLLWTILDKAGCSSTAERIDLMQTFLNAFPDQKVASFAGDRKFIGNAWIAWLHDNGVPYVLRLRESMKSFLVASYGDARLRSCDLAVCGIDDPHCGNRCGGQRRSSVACRLPRRVVAPIDASACGEIVGQPGHCGVSEPECPARRPGHRRRATASVAHRRW